MYELSDAKSRRSQAARQRRQAVQMIRSGESLDSVATRLGVTRSVARQMVNREARDFAHQTAAEDRRMVHVEALMALWRVLYTPACRGDLEAVDRFLRVEERLSRLLALDLADQIDLTDDREDAGGADVDGDPVGDGRRFVRD